MVNLLDLTRIEGMSETDQRLCVACINTWQKYIARNSALSERYDGTYSINNLEIAIPPEIAKQYNKPALMWSHQAVERIINGSAIEGYKFIGDAPEGFVEAMSDNHFKDKYDETLPSEGTHGIAFMTATAGGKDEPPFVISTYDAMHAGVLWDTRRDRELCGVVIVETDVTSDVLIPTVVNYHSPNGDIYEIDGSGDAVLTRRIKCGTGRPCIVALRHNPDKAHPLGKSMITPAIMSIEDEANRNSMRIAVGSEVYAYPTKYMSGANDDVMSASDNKIALNKWLAVPPINEDGAKPEIGQLNGADMQPLLNYDRALANKFAAEAHIPINAIISTEANPASAEAIEASNHDRIEKTEKLNRVNEAAIKKLAMLCISILTEKPVTALNKNEKSFTVQWKNPTLTSLAASADAAQKLASACPGFAGTPTYWHMLGYNDAQISEINAEIDANIAHIVEGAEGGDVASEPDTTSSDSYVMGARECGA